MFHHRNYLINLLQININFVGHFFSELKYNLINKFLKLNREDSQKIKILYNVIKIHLNLC